MKYIAITHCKEYVSCMGIKPNRSLCPKSYLRMVSAAFKCIPWCNPHPPPPKYVFKNTAIQYICRCGAVEGDIYYRAPVFVKVYVDQESIPRNRFRQPSLAGRYDKQGCRTGPPGWKLIPRLLKGFYLRALGCFVAVCNQAAALCKV